MNGELNEHQLNARWLPAVYVEKLINLMPGCLDIIGMSHAPIPLLLTYYDWRDMP